MLLRIAFGKFACAALAFAAFTAAAQAASLTVLHNFPVNSLDGTAPQNGLVADSAGNLYGTTFSGGPAAVAGTVFRIGSGGGETILYTFKGGTDGVSPASGLAIDKQGNLYGTTQLGGAANQGTVFELINLGNGGYREVLIHDFCTVSGCPDGRIPTGGVIVTGKGVLYGTAVQGGQGLAQTGQGTAFEMDPPTKKNGAWTFNVIHAFCNQGGCADGSGPYAGQLLRTADGSLYGTTRSGGGGTVYKLTPDGSGSFGFSMLHLFSVTDHGGYSPQSGVVVDDHGTLYGTTQRGGSGDCGVAFSLNPLSLAYAIIHDFCLRRGDGSLIEASLKLVNGKKGPTLYGTTLQGGKKGDGTIYRITPAPKSAALWKEQILYSFCTKTNCADGNGPAFGTLVLRAGHLLYGTTAGGGAHSSDVNGSGTVFQFDLTQP